MHCCAGAFIIFSSIGECPKKGEGSPVFIMMHPGSDDTNKRNVTWSSITTDIQNTNIPDIPVIDTWSHGKWNKSSERNIPTYHGGLRKNITHFYIGIKNLKKNSWRWKMSTILVRNSYLQWHFRFCTIIGLDKLDISFFLFHSVS